MVDFKKIIKDGIIGGIVNPSSSGAPGSGAPPSAAQVLEALGETAIPLATTLLYVDSVTGLDTNVGTAIGTPYQTLGKALGAVRGLRNQGRNHKVHIILAGSTDTGYAANPKVYPVIPGDFNESNNVNIRCNTYMVIDGPFRATTTADLDWDGGCLMTVLADDAGVAYNPGWVPGNTYKNATPGDENQVGLRGGYFVTGEVTSLPGQPPNNMTIAADQTINWWQNAWPVVGATSNNQLRCCLYGGTSYIHTWWANNGVPVPGAMGGQFGITDPSTFAISGHVNPAGGNHAYSGKNWLVRLAARIDFHGSSTGQIQYQPNTNRLEFFRVYLGPEYDEPDATKFVYWRPNMGGPVKYQFSAWGPVKLHNAQYTGSSYGGYFRLVHKSSISHQFKFVSAVLDMGHPNFLEVKIKEGGALEFHDQCAFIDNTSPRGVKIMTGCSMETKSGAEEIPAVSTEAADFDGASIFLDNSYGPSCAAYNAGIERLVFHGQLPVGGTNYVDYQSTVDFEGVSPQDDVRLSDGVTQATAAAKVRVPITTNAEQAQVLSGADLSLRWRIPADGKLEGIFVVPIGGAVNVTSGAYTIDAWVGLTNAGTRVVSSAFSLNGLAADTEAAVNTLTTTAADLEMVEGDYLYLELNNAGGGVTGPTSIMITCLFYLN